MARSDIKSAGRMTAAFAMLAILPLGAVAQAVEFTWQPSAPAGLENGPIAARFLAGDALAVCNPDPADPALRLVDAREESESDREGGSRILAHCELLARIPGWTALDFPAGLPNGMLDLASGAFRSEPDRGETLSMRSPRDSSFLSRVLSCPIGDPSGHPFDDLVGHVASRERVYFARFQDSALPAFGFEEDPGEIDMGALTRDQNRILFDSCRELYFGRFAGTFDRRFHDDAVDVAAWHPVDFVVAPVLLTGYVYQFGWGCKFDALGLKWAFQFEPLRRILERRRDSGGDLVSAAGVEIGVGTLPVKVIVSMGLMDGEAGVDFIGFGTSLGEAGRWVSQALSSRRERE